MSALARVVLATPPTSGIATPISATRIDLSWPQVVGAIQYQVYRAGVLVDTQLTNSSSSTGLTASTLYAFQISSTGQDGQEGPKGSQFSATTLALPDTIAPSVPVIAVTSISSSTQSITLTTASTDTGGSGLASYTLERATNSGFTANLTSQSVATNGFSVSATGLLPSTQYFYRCRAVDGASNQSANSATVNAVTQSGANLPPAWSGATAIALQVGVPASLNFDSGFCLDPEGQPVTYTDVTVGGALAGAGGALSGTRGEVMSFVPTTPGVYVVTIRANDSASSASDWATRSVGKTYANNFDYASRAAMIASASAGIVAGYVGAPSGQSNDDPPPAAAKVDLDSTVGLSSGKSLKLRFVNGQENLTQNGPSYRDSWGVALDVFFMAFAIRFNQKWLDTPHAGGTNTKHMIVFTSTSGFSSGQQGLLTVAPDPRLPGAWLVDGGGFNRFQNTWSSNPPGSGDGTLHNFVDFGPQSSGANNDGNSENYFQRRYGPTRNQFGDFDSVFDHANYPIQYRADTWYRWMLKVDKTADEIKWWFSEDGQAPTLVFGRSNAGIPDQDYTGFQFILRPTDGTDQAFSGDDLVQWGNEIIVDPNLIPWSGGFSVPYSGAGQFPSGYPYGSSSEDV